ncbi:NAD(P)/FAD-dependent oxidoreductase [Muricoccus radiodurans]|uniref:NAD(P)/FAD-dependent oxidoreductase n=1 Tax=Muricoccus radiodurans TaxID=2231721 RepID=UPI003CF32D1C
MARVGEGGGTVLVLGAGVAGLSVALNLRRAGRDVAVLDPAEPGSGASSGNSGLISASAVAPLSMPGMLRQVPRWLLDPLGPLAIRPAYLPRAVPYLLRWARAGRPERVLAVSDGLRALHAASHDEWARLLGTEGAEGFIRRTGQVLGFEGPPLPGAGALDAMLRERHGIAAEPLDRAAMERMFPGIAPGVTRGLLLPENGHSLDPGRMVGVLADRLRAEGGAIRAERVRAIRPRDGGWQVSTEAGEHAAAVVVVALGARSNALLAPLGRRLPMEAERGYHAMLPEPSAALPRPISFRHRGLALTPMAGGLRASGTVEFAGVEAPPDMRRAEGLVRQAAQVFPDLRHGAPRFWMGARPGLPDSLPALGAAGMPGLFLCTGHGHFGLTSGPPSGRLVAEMILGVPPFLDAGAYDPGRFGTFRRG